MRDAGPSPLAWLALAALGAGLVAAALLLAPWRMHFSLRAEEAYSLGAAASAGDGDDRWLLTIAWAYEKVRLSNVRMVDWMTRLSALFAGLVVVHAALWIAVLMGVE